MPIVISQKLRPYSKLSSVTAALPLTGARATVHPARLLLQNGAKMLLFDWDLAAPLSDFTVFLHLDRAEIFVFSRELRYRITAKEGILFEKTPKNFKYAKNEIIPVPFTSIERPATMERLFLGVDKAQDVDMMRRRMDLKEILPFWFALGQLLPCPAPCIAGAAGLVQSGQLEEGYKTGFSSLFAPRLNDEDFQGILPPERVAGDASSLAVIGYQKIRELFFSESGGRFSILKNLPAAFTAGRLINLNCAPYGVWHLEWTKKMIRRAIFKSHRQGELSVIWPSKIRSFRLNGKNVSVKEAILVQKDSSYYFDCFQK